MPSLMTTSTDLQLTSGTQENQDGLGPGSSCTLDSSSTLPSSWKKHKTVSGISMVVSVYV